MSEGANRTVLNRSHFAFFTASYRLTSLKRHQFVATDSASSLPRYRSPSLCA
ncbi:hypothetical protein [Paraburkholderia fungorum]